MARKRGGIAGFYDRNKKIIKPVATGLAGLFGTPALGAAVGAAFGGLDRPGKSGIGLDVMGAAKGGLSGYAMGKLGQSAKGGLGKIFTGGGVPKLPSMPDGLTSVYDTQNRSSNAANLGKMASKGAGFLKEYEDVLGKAAGGLQATRNADLADEQVRLRIAEEARQFDEAQKLRVRQQGNYDQTAMMDKQQFDELNANRARLRAILTGGM